MNRIVRIVFLPAVRFLAGDEKLSTKYVRKIVAAAPFFMRTEFVVPRILESKGDFAIRIPAVLKVASITNSAAVEALEKNCSSSDAATRVSNHIAMLTAGLKEQRAGVLGAMLEFVAQRVRNESGLVRPTLYDYLANRARTQMLLLGLPFLESPFNVGNESRRYHAADPTSFDAADLDLSQRLVRAISLGKAADCLHSEPTRCGFLIVSTVRHPCTRAIFCFILPDKRTTNYRCSVSNAAR